MDFAPGVNVLVGGNDTGKSTLIEAIGLALTGRVHGRFLTQELSPYFINLDATREYVVKLKAGTKPLPEPPVMTIEVFLDGEEVAILRGTNNLCNEDDSGVRIVAWLSQDLLEEYLSFISNPGSVNLVPTEYYKVDWLGFSGNPITARSVPATASVIDPSTLRLQTGVDYHLQQIIRTYLEPKERVELSRQYRSVREDFVTRDTVKAINKRLSVEEQVLSDRVLTLAIDISHRYTWENSVVAHLDEIPFQFTGQGDQNALKTLLAIGRKASDAQVVLIEEPENHLSFAYLRRLTKRIEDQCQGKQLIVATHSTFVLNKLGLEHLILLGDDGVSRITALPNETVEYFRKLAGFDTLRLVLAKGAILVEGPSDELIVQRGYLDAKGRLPVEDGIDVISVGTAHKRFLDLAVSLRRRVWIVVDNDGKSLDDIKKRFEDYLDQPYISLHTGVDPTLPTLEPQIVAANDLQTLNNALDKEFLTVDEAQEWMGREKTAAALAIFDSKTNITMPRYIQDVIDG